ncbi:hypothetical protein PR048_012907 [Dryococelus australis]|uniref:Uncharacterized protein n=1 Tax=Dryococelus australis TaxID=614101 RepID=A0ABQ9HQP4_9NEOP|nr:hypothetical protein PR048_012907 [Dryococelus australis]
MARFHPSGNYFDVQPGDGSTTYSFQIGKYRATYTETCDEILLCSMHGDCIKFYIRKETPLTCAVDELMSFAKKQQDIGVEGMITSSHDIALDETFVQNATLPPN